MASSSCSSSLLLLLGVVCGCAGVRICAFNVQGFGESKAQNPKVMHTLVRIIARCDVCLLQEVRDQKKRALPALLESLNRYDPDHDYQYVASEPLGRKSYKEQYVFVYRTGSVAVTGQYQYPDSLPGDEDAFSREPFVVRFKAPSTALGEFVLIPQHTSPSNATREIDALYDVFQAVKKRWNTEMVMFLGDFNADCGYVAKKNRVKVRLYSDPSFLWLISDKEDTTVRASTSCTYDRIVVHGSEFSRGIVPYSAKPFNFDKEYQLSEEQALEVSDHYPVEVVLKSGSSLRRGSSLLGVSSTLQGVSTLLLLFLTALLCL
ncbi:deoxyribonuclease-1-like 1 [Osmerus mordax]|uniref:Deoxyribonuclease-1-like 1 n=1 Tax=Osmerus mordax TaxID=8014 RepID=C1BLX0_OSMMO|nr:Deoxyribonuclease gamma precursor [Osmerus mordax]